MSREAPMPSTHIATQVRHSGPVMMHKRWVMIFAASESLAPRRYPAATGENVEGNPGPGRRGPCDWEGLCFLMLGRR